MRRMTLRRSRGWWMLGLSVVAAGCEQAPAAPEDAAVEAGTDLGAADTGATDAGAADAKTTDDAVGDDAPKTPVDDAPAVEMDTPPAVDVPVVAVDVPDVPSVPEDRGAPPAACDPAALVDLNARGTRDGLRLRYAGTNAAAPRGPSLRATCVGADGLGEAVYQVVHRYVPSVTGRLRVSLDDAATAATFDTILFAQRECFPLRVGEEPLDCNDDVAASVAMRPVASAILTPRVVAGVPVYLVVAGAPRSADDPLRPQGAYALSVTELPEVALGQACDVAGATNACAPGSGCVDGGAGAAPRCVANGLADARCRSDGSAECDAGLRCSLEFCRRTLALAAVCGVGIAGVCPAESSCQWVDGANRCVRTGARGADCRDDAPRGAAALACVHTRFGDHCRPAVAAAGRCDPWGFRDACATGYGCGLSPLGALGTCVAPGSVAGAPCLPGALNRCAAGLECRPSPDGENEVCVRPAAAAGRCDPLDGTTVCSNDTDCVPTTALSDGVCVEPGTAPGAPCRGDATRCDAGLACSVATGEGRCLRTAATGAACDLRYFSTRCASGGCTADSATAATCRAPTAEVEPNDAPGSGTAIAGAAVAIAGALGATDTRDCIRVAVPEGASLVAETFTGDARVCAPAGGDPSVTVYGPSGVEVVREDDSPRRGLCTTIAPWTHPQATGLAAGTYAVCVERGGAAVPTYRLTVSVFR
jgi:hypothetical protein